jgi:hypothetical protein
MVCALEERITETYWTWCWAWFIPYPCRHTHQVTRYQYDFRPWRTRFSWLPFRESYEACCGGALYAWSTFAWSAGTVNGDWIDTNWTYLSDVKIGSTEPCPFQPPQAPTPGSLG